MKRRAYIGPGSFVGALYWVIGLGGTVGLGRHLESIGIHFDADTTTFDADTHTFDEY